MSDYGLRDHIPKTSSDEDLDVEWATANEVVPSRRPEPPARPRIAEQTLDRFAGSNPRVLDESEFGPAELYMIERTRRDIAEVYAHVRDDIKSDTVGRGMTELLEHPRDDCRFIVHGHILMVVERSNNELIGGISAGTLYINPEERGRGIARDMHINLQALDYHILAPSHYSSGGYGARLAAHREASLLDFQAGLTVHPENLERYSEAIAALKTKEPEPGF